jgi:SAM-dependent methyltransferase
VAYDQSWHVHFSEDSSRAAQRILSYVIGTFSPRSYLDVGSGIGNWARTAQDLGVADVLAVDGPWTKRENLAIDPSCFRVVDLERRQDFGRRFDLAISVEVAEHVSESAADDFVATLTDHADLVLFGAAIPGQGGYQHINEQWQSYWIAKFVSKGFLAADLIRPRFWLDREIPVFYRQNTFVFVNKERSDLVSIVRGQRPNFEGERILDAAHPEKFEEVARYRTAADKFTRWIPRRVVRTIKTRFEA